MAAQADLTVFDGATTPVSHSLKAMGVSVKPDGSTVSYWREQLASLPDEAQVSFTLVQRKLRSGVMESRAKIEVPVMESISGQNASGYTAAPKVAFVESEEIISRKHPRSTPTTRQIALQMLRNLFNNVSVTTPAITAGVVKEFMQDGVNPS